VKVDLGKLRELLKKETYPHEYFYKFIGKNTGVFTQGLHALEGRFPRLELKGSRESAGGQNLAVTYSLYAQNEDEIIAVLEQVSLVEDLLVIL
jgi:putative lipoic acid-binding regulatory protein